MSASQSISDDAKARAISWMEAAAVRVYHAKNVCSVVAAMASMCDDKLTVYTSLKYLSHVCRLEEQIVNYCVFYLIKQGLLEWTRCSSYANAYRLILAPRRMPIGVIVVVRP